MSTIIQNALRICGIDKDIFECMDEYEQQDVVRRAWEIVNKENA